MKKFVFLLAASLSLSVQGQDISDAVRFAQENLNGTARFRAMGGAFGALGGDFSSININPAGSVVFANSQAGFTLSNFNNSNDSNFFGTNKNKSNNSLDLSQAGGVYVFKNEDKRSDWKKFAVALNYENIKDFNNSFFSAGTNSNSVANYFLSYANGLPLSIVNGSQYSYSDLYYNEQQAYLGYGAYVINEAADYSDTNMNYVSLVPAGGSYYQENKLYATGYNGKLSFNGSAQYKDVLTVGVNLNSHFFDYYQSTHFYESNANNTSATDVLVKRLKFDNDLYTYGNGFSFQIGTIYKPIKEVRFGIAYQSPTWLRLTDELTQSIAAVSGTSTTEYQPDVVNPGITMLFEPYRLQTPSKWTGSFAYIFGKKGLISFDYATKNYSKTKYTPKQEFTNSNANLRNLLTSTNEYRLGAEYRIKKVSLRAGYRFEQSPYKDKITIGDLTAYSGGIGYNFGATKLDLAYSTSNQNSKQQFFTQGLTDAASIQSKNNTVCLTLLFEL